MLSITINQDTCVKCGACVEVCPRVVLEQADRTEFPVGAHPDLCIVCGHCSGVCPTLSLLHSKFPDEKVVKIDRDKLPSIDSTMELLLARRSVREFKDKPVEKSDLETIIAAGLSAPSAHNSESTQYIVIQDPELLDQVRSVTVDYFRNLVKTFKYPIIRSVMSLVAAKAVKVLNVELPKFNKMLARYDEGHDAILAGAKALVVFHAPDDAPMPSVNANLAYQNASLAAEALGLGAFYCGFILGAAKNETNGKVAATIGVPDGHSIHAAMAIGHPKYKYKSYIHKKPAVVKWR